jgi:hypothetical protein
LRVTYLTIYQAEGRTSISGAMVSNRTNGTSPAFVGFIALTGIILSGSPTLAGDECLAAPNSPAPPGSHWYYRSDRSTQRKCWYVRPEDRQDRAEKSAAAAETAATNEPTKTSRQTERADPRPAAVSNKIQAEASVSETSQPGAATALTPGAADEQPTSLDKPNLPSMPSPAAVSNSGMSDSTGENSGPASAVSFNEAASAAPSEPTTTASALADSSPQTAGYQTDVVTKDAADQATFTPMRVLLLIPAVLALAGVLAFALVPSRLRRRIYAGRWGSSSAATSAQEKMFPRFNDTIAEPDGAAPQFDMPDEFKRNLRQVLQTLEAQLRGDVELEEALAQRRSSKPAWG